MALNQQNDSAPRWDWGEAVQAFIESAPRTSCRKHLRSPWKNARVEACGLQRGLFKHSLLRTNRCVSSSNCVAINNQPYPKFHQKKAHNSDIYRTKCMCGMNQSTVLPFEARRRAWSGDPTKATPAFDTAKPGWNRTLDQREVGSEVVSSGGVPVGI